ncbi:MAG: hypothetical protein ACKOX6_10265 [Bdellovibrio sp.]
MKIEIQGKANSEKYEYGFAEVRVYSQRETLMKVVKALAVFWGLAIFSILLPVVHFVLVPLFLFLGVFMAFRARKYHEEMLSGEINCPHCGSLVKIGKAPILWPLSEICQNCASVVRISPKS